MIPGDVVHIPLTQFGGAASAARPQNYGPHYCCRYSLARTRTSSFAESARSFSFFNPIGMSLCNRRISILLQLDCVEHR